MTKGDLDEGCEYSWKDVAHDIHEALVSRQLLLKLVTENVAIPEYHQSPLYRCRLVDYGSCLPRLLVPQDSSHDISHRSEP
jgi:hypothetical protein